MNEMPKCLECNEELKVVDCYDIDFEGTNEIIASTEGICPKCKTEYTWQDVFEFKRFQKLKVI